MITPKLKMSISPFHTFQYLKGQMAIHITSLTVVQLQNFHRLYKWESVYTTNMPYQELNFDHVHRRVSFWQHGSHLIIYKHNFDLVFISELTSNQYTLVITFILSWNNFTETNYPLQSCGRFLFFIFFYIIKLPSHTSLT